MENEHETEIRGKPGKRGWPRRTGHAPTTGPAAVGTRRMAPSALNQSDMGRATMAQPDLQVRRIAGALGVEIHGINLVTL